MGDPVGYFVSDGLTYHHRDGSGMPISNIYRERGLNKRSFQETSNLKCKGIGSKFYGCERRKHFHPQPLCPSTSHTLLWRHNGEVASQITSLTIVYSTVYTDADQRKHQSSASLAFVCGIHRGPVTSPHKWPVMRKMFPFDDVIM